MYHIIFQFLINNNLNLDDIVNKITSSDQTTLEYAKSIVGNDFDEARRALDIIHSRDSQKHKRTIDLLFHLNLKLLKAGLISVKAHATFLDPTSPQF